jgi:hypothetical protein
MYYSQFLPLVSQAAQPKALVYRGISYDSQTTEVYHSDCVSKTPQSAVTLCYRGVSYLSPLYTNTLSAVVRATTMMYRGCSYSI